MTRDTRRSVQSLAAAAGAVKARPTRRHRLAISPGILGTVYAVSPDGEARYFDYDHEAAWAWARILPGADLRWFRGHLRGRPVRFIRSGCAEAEPGGQRWCLYATDPGQREEPPRDAVVVPLPAETQPVLC